MKNKIYKRTIKNAQPPKVVSSDFDGFRVEVLPGWEGGNSAVFEMSWHDLKLFLAGVREAAAEVSRRLESRKNYISRIVEGSQAG